MHSLAHGASLQVLVLEDEPAIGRSLVRGLRQAGHECHLVERCARVRELEQSFDVAVLDLELPDGVSVDVAEELLGFGTTRAVVFFSGASDQLLLARAARLGVVVSKSAPFAELLEAIEATQIGPASEWRQLRPTPNSARHVGR